MNDPPIFRLTLLTMLSTLAGAAASLVACEATNANYWAAAAAMLAGSAVPGYFVYRWWTAACRRAGVLTDANPKLRPGEFVAYLAFFAAAVTVAYASYALTRARAVEFLLGFLIMVPFALIFQGTRYATLPVPAANEAKVLRFTAVSQAAVPLLMLTSVVMQLRTTHPENLPPILDFTVALAVVVAPLSLVAAYFSRLRYISALRGVRV